MEHTSNNGLSAADLIASAEGATASAAKCLNPTDDSTGTKVSGEDLTYAWSDATDEQSLRTTVIEWSTKYTKEERLKITRILKRLGKISQAIDDTEDDETTDGTTVVEDMQRSANYTEQDRCKIIQMVQQLRKGSKSVSGIEDVEDLIVLVTSSGSRAIEEMMLKFKSMSVNTKDAKWNDTRGKKKGPKKQQRAGSKIQPLAAEAKQEPRAETNSACLYSHFFNTLGEWIVMTPNPDDVATTDLSLEFGNQMQVSGTDVRSARQEGTKGGGAATGGNMAMRAGTVATEGSSKVIPGAAEQHRRQTWLRITGIYERNHEDTKEIVLTMADAVDADIDDDDILKATRHSAEQHTTQQREIYVKFTNEPTRQKFFDATRPSQLHQLDKYKHAHVHEILIPARQKLFNTAWFLQKENTINQVWTNKGEIYVKDNDLKIHHIVSPRDLQKFMEVHDRTRK